MVDEEWLIGHILEQIQARIHLRIHPCGAEEKKCGYEKCSFHGKSPIGYNSG
jgi:hypothetical protein